MRGGGNRWKVIFQMLERIRKPSLLRSHVRERFIYIGFQRAEIVRGDNLFQHGCEVYAIQRIARLEHVLHVIGIEKPVMLQPLPVFGSDIGRRKAVQYPRSEEHTSELQSLMRI